MLHSVYAVPRLYCSGCKLNRVYAALDIWCKNSCNAVAACCTWCILYLVYAVLSVCCTWCMLYLEYAVLGVWCTRSNLMIMAWWNRDGWPNSYLSGAGIVEGETQRKKRRWVESWWGTGTWENLVCRWICDSTTAGNTPNPVGKNTALRYSELNLVSNTPKFSNSLLSCISFLYLSLISLSCPHLLYHHRTQIWIICAYISMPWSWVNT